MDNAIAQFVSSNFTVISISEIFFDR